MVINLPDNAKFVQLTSNGGGVCTTDVSGVATTVPINTTTNPLNGTTAGVLTCVWSGGITANAYKEVTYQVMAHNAPSVGNCPEGTCIVNAATVGLVDPSGVPYRVESNLGNNQASIAIKILPAKADIMVDIDGCQPNSVLLGGVTVCTIEVQNNGPSLATEVLLTNMFTPDTAVFEYEGSLTVDKGGVCTEPSTGTQSGTLTCTWTSLNAGDVAKVT
jgi:hypothetical protein